MTQGEILKELRKRTVTERLAIIEAALTLIREDVQRMERPLPHEQTKRQLAAAAETLLPDYEAAGELTAFAALERASRKAAGLHLIGMGKMG